MPFCLYFLDVFSAIFRISTLLEKIFIVGLSYYEYFSILMVDNLFIFVSLFTVNKVDLCLFKKKE